MNTGKESENTTHITALRLHPLKEKSTNCKRKSVPVHLAVNIENFLCKIKKSKIQEKKEAKEMPRRKADSCSSSYTRYALTINVQIPSTINIEDMQVIKLHQVCTNDKRANTEYNQHRRRATDQTRSFFIAHQHAENHLYTARQQKCCQFTSGCDYHRQ